MVPLVGDECQIEEAVKQDISISCSPSQVENMEVSTGRWRQVQAGVRRSRRYGSEQRIYSIWSISREYLVFKTLGEVAQRV